MEEEVQAAEAEQGDAVDSESSVDMPNNNPTKRGRGRPQGSKKLKVCVTDANLMQLVSGISNGESTQTHKRRGRPRLSGATHAEQQRTGGSDAENSAQTPRGRGRPKGSKKPCSDEDIPMTDHSPKKRGRPRKSVEGADAEVLPNGGSETAKKGRGRPKGSQKRKSGSLTSEDESSPVTPRKRGRPKGSMNKAKLGGRVTSDGQAGVGRLKSTKRGRGRPRKVELNNNGGSVESNGISKKPRRGRGRPRKSIEMKSGDRRELVTGGSQLAKRGRGRPKGSLNKKHPKVGQPWAVRVLGSKGRRGRPRKQPAKRGRPRKYPLPSPDELKRPKVWKPLGRPRKYPRVEPQEGVQPATPRSRGRPRKSESKKGAHLRKSHSIPFNTSDGSPRKRGRPPSSSRSERDAPRKRGRPKGSVNKSKARGETQLDSANPNYSSAFGTERDGAKVEQKPDTDVMSDVLAHNTEEMFDDDASFDLSNQA